MKNKTLLLLSLLLSISAFSAEPVVLTKDNTITINDIFTPESVAPIIQKAKELDSRVKTSDPIYLVVHSRGGSIQAGLDLIENLSSLRRPVDTITIFSASMGFQTVQGLGKRLVLANGTLMSHKSSGMFYGEFPGQLDTRYQYYLKRVTRMDERAASRTGGKQTLKTYQELIRNEYWCDGADCVAAGFADAVVNSTCDKSLDGVTTQSLYQNVVQGHTLEITADYDNCPLNTNALRYDLLVDGNPIFPKGAGPFIGSLTGLNSSSLNGENLYEIFHKAKEVIKERQSNEVVKSY